MQPLNGTDLDQVSAFLRQVYAEVRLQELPRVILEGLRQLIPCEHTNYNEIDSRTDQALILMHPFVPDVLRLAPALEARFFEHPVLNHFRLTADRKPCQTADFVSQRQFRQMGIYRDFYRHVDTEHQIGVLLSEADAACDIAIGLNRTLKAFAERDRSILELARPARTGCC